jgi:hypothetical protein
MTQFGYAIGPDTRITFPAKPDDSIRALMKGAGFRWSPAAGCWWRRGVNGAADFIAVLDRKLNSGRPDGACWRCKSPNGYFRRQGAATPVHCDACHAALTGGFKPDRFDLDHEELCRAACGL